MLYIVSAVFGTICSLYCAYTINLYSQTMREPLEPQMLAVIMGGAFVFPFYFIAVSMLKPGRIPFVRRIALVIHVLVVLSFIMGAISSVGWGIEVDPEKNPLPLIVGIIAVIGVAVATYTNLKWSRQNLIEA